MIKLDGAEAFLLVWLRTNQTGDILNSLKNFEEVVEVHNVHNENSSFDLIIKIHSPSHSELHKIIMGKIRKLPQILKTETLLVIN